jgi:hypothetical protein
MWIRLRLSGTGSDDEWQNNEFNVVAGFIGCA